MKTNHFTIISSFNHFSTIKCFHIHFSCYLVILYSFRNLCGRLK
ncbi:hypothetical protein E2C01_059527 [Portunus trituberculatus]|uniref:Uncharacterized protein n=1 Tax=Portunus trituberculatus TaxID=210409 RepID=A0A5B7H5L0_PORTR|nr:hypothetical protein [Portunus trituberculatus]